MPFVKNRNSISPVLKKDDGNRLEDFVISSINVCGENLDLCTDDDPMFDLDISFSMNGRKHE